jgi:L-fuconolactonase
MPDAANGHATKPSSNDGKLEPLYDTHAHFYTADAGKYPINPAGAREGEEALVHRIMADPGTPERVFGLWDASGVAAGAAVQFNTAYKTDNRYVLDITDAHRERIGAVIILDANDPATPLELARLAGRHGVTGLRLVGYAGEDGRYSFLTTDEAMATWAQAERLGVAIVLMIRLSPGESPAPTLARVGELAGRFPRLRIVLDHCGWPGFVPSDDPVGLTAAHRALAACANISFKVTSINFTRFEKEGISAERFLREAVDIYGADRMMWGSDFGNTLTDYVVLADKARRSAALLNEAERRAYLHDGGARIFSQRRA